MAKAALETGVLGRAVLTGATGYLGVHLASMLAARGIAVIAPLRPLSDPARLLARAPSVRLVPLASPAALTDIIAGADTDVVIHLASPPASAPQETIHADGAAMSGALTAATTLRPGLAIVAAGTWWEWDEAGRVAPANAYAAAKLAQRTALGDAARAADGRFVTVIPYDIYGADDWRAKLMPDLIAKARSGERLAMTSGRQQIDWVHVDDVAAAFVRAAEIAVALAPGASALFTAGTGLTRDLRTLVDQMTAAGGQPVIDWGALPERPGQRLRPFYPAPAVPGWQPEVALEAFLRDQFAQ